MKPKWKSSFQDDWLLPSTEHKHHKWIARVPNDKYSARCKICVKKFLCQAQVHLRWSPMLMEKETQKRMPADDSSAGITISW